MSEVSEIYINQNYFLCIMLQNAGIFYARLDFNG